MNSIPITSFTRIWTVLFCASVVAVSVSCSDDGGGPGPICFEKRCHGNADEVGDGDGDPDDDYEFCTVQAGNGERTVHQCEGQLAATLQFHTLLGDCAKTLGDPAWCREAHYFGLEDPYALPAVMACCDAIDTPEEDLLDYCTKDLVEQVCRSVPLRLQSLISSGQFKNQKLVENQAKNLLRWLNANQQECYNALYRPSGEPGVIEPTQWLVNGGNNKGWRLLRDFTITLDHATVESAYLPEDVSQHVACEDTKLNNTEIFEARGPVMPMRDIEFYHLGDSIRVPIRGPGAPGVPGVYGMAGVASQLLCELNRCSVLEVGHDGNGLLLNDLGLFAASEASFHYGEMVVQVENLALRLYGVNEGHLFDSADTGYVAYIIPPGDAHFIVTGTWGAMVGVRWATNSTPITLRSSGDDGWIIESFSIEHTDSSGAWRATVPLTTWD